jgi:hypothetical protein
MKKFRWSLLILLLAAATVAIGQGGGRRRGGRGFGGYGGWGDEGYVPDDARTAREVDPHSRDSEGNILVTPNWTNAAGFEKDVFTFVRIKRQRSPYKRGGSWKTDTPDSDLNLSFRLQQVTSIKVDPDGRYLGLTEKELADYPLIYMVEPGTLTFDDDEVQALRKYLLNGGFLWVDDFWGDSEWEGMEEEIKKVFPDRNFVELELTHPIYHCVFEIKAKNQIPNYRVGEASQYTGITWETDHDGDVRTVHHRAIFDDKGRMMVLATHNTDNGDGWEREGEYHYFFEHFSEKTAYPLAINVIFYVMTH